MESEFVKTRFGDLYASKDGRFMRNRQKANLLNSKKGYAMVTYNEYNGIAKKAKTVKAMNIIYDTFVRPVNMNREFLYPKDDDVMNVSLDNILVLPHKKEINGFRKTSIDFMSCTRNGKFHIVGTKAKLYGPDRYHKYKYLSFKKQGKRYFINAARMVYDTWVRPTDMKREFIFPKDGNLSNISADNLYIKTNEEISREGITKHYKAKISVEYVLEELSIKKTEIDLAIYFCTTGKFDRYNEYVEKILYKRLFDFSMTKLSKSISCKRAMDLVAEAIAALYVAIDANRGISNLTDCGKNIIRRLCKRNCLHPYKSIIKPIRRPIDDVDFEKIARKYGLIDLYPSPNP